MRHLLPSCCAVALTVVRLGAQAPVAAPHAPPTGLRDRAELEAFIDGFMTLALQDKHVAGATVSVVKDGALFFAKGYGWADVRRRTPVDPATTLFRIGSISKLFTWTAVMQLVEQGKLDLDRDVNDYLDFKIPATFPEPITLRHVMTHTPGLEEDARGLFSDDTTRLAAMGTWLPSHMPKRVRPPGTYAAYSNWATGLAGYIVQRVSGVPWEQYIEQQILQPLGMTHTSGRQPLPAALAPDMSKGYVYRSGDYTTKPFEIIPGLAPAGSVSASATDIARLALVHLNDGELEGHRILADSTAKRMHARAFGHDPRLNGFALGFYEKSSHGLRIIGHGGDTQWFHSDLALLPSERVAVFVSYNTDTGARLTAPFLTAFLDHYYPEPAPVIASQATAAQLKRFAGEYLPNRTSYSTFMKAAGLLDWVTISVGDSGTLIREVNDEQARFAPADSLLFRAVNNATTMSFRADASGRITHLYLRDLPMIAFEKQSGLAAPALHLTILGTALGIFTLTLIAAVVRVFTRRNRRSPTSRLPGRSFAIGLSLCYLAGIIALTATGGNSDAIIHEQLGAIKASLVLPVIGALFTVLALLSAVAQWRRNNGTRWARLRYDIIAVAGALFGWSLYHWNLLGWRM
jgi:CubicO group peptidase (beta-lactamase class C family)